MRRHVRIARPVSDLARSTAIYRDGLGIDVLGRFDDHDGFDGAMLGPAEGDWHVELTHCRTHPVHPQPTPEDLLVLYLPDAGDWRSACDRMLAAGFVAAPSFNPYWDRRGRTFEDPDGYRVVIQNAPWRDRASAPSPSAAGAGAPVEIRPGYVPGCIGRIAQLHASWYSANAGFGVYFESKVARELGEFCERCVDGRDGLWLATRSGTIEGSIAIDGSRAAADGAHLRWFVVSDALRGRGVGNELIDRSIAFCRDCGYDRIHLWTFQGLDAAAHLYRKHGFRLALERPGTRWGREVVEQRYELDGV